MTTQIADEGVTRGRRVHRHGVPLPSLLLLKWFTIWTLLGVLHAITSLFPEETAVIMMRDGLLIIWWLLGGFFIFLALWDLIWIRWRIPDITVTRKLPSRLALGEWNIIELNIDHNSRTAMELLLTDFYPNSADVKSIPAVVDIEPGETTTVLYSLKPKKRGLLALTKLQLHLYSRWQLWIDVLWIERYETVKVYPNFLTLDHCHQEMVLNQMKQQAGLRRVRPRGEGMEFHQLRHYQPGDALRQIDWKATARHRQVISREYQAESDQTVLFLLDGGRRMRIIDHEMTLFDHAIRSALLLSKLAIEQGDAVGLLSFGAQERWLPPAKSNAQINRLLNTLYDLEAAPVASDYLTTAKSIMIKQQRRSLIILMSHIRDENLGELIPAIQYLQRRHMVLVVNLQEPGLQEILKKEIDSYEMALRYAATVHYLQQCRQVHDRFLRDNILSCHSTPDQLVAALTLHYQAIKSSGQL